MQLGTFTTVTFQNPTSGDVYIADTSTVPILPAFNDSILNALVNAHWIPDTQIVKNTF